ncbi:hypothetical protein B0H17DRAFT_399131 [Mycena rosella]|uniref:Uncharacterized protein n=1 Tax=Mycena rosella TaxID=1033263 RepID=A0AAD7DPV0_MYCRO|nr:hypothetical protein B0H17DRAFT_399131 [Mycena rosella]
MLDQIPPELCARIFDFACRDSGYTGRSLSLVSWYINATSQPAKLQSIALAGRQQILAFATLLARTPAHLRTTRYLFVNGQETEEEMEAVMDAAYEGLRKAHRERSCVLKSLSPAEMEVFDAEVTLQQEKTQKFLHDFGKEGAEAVESILRDVAPTLELLDLALNEYVAKKVMSPLSLPRLADLTTRCGFPLHPKGIPVLAPCPSLRRLHVVEANEQWASTPRFFENGISHFAPALTHFRLSQLDQDDDAINYLEGALGLCTPPAAPRRRVTPLPATLQLVLIKPAVAPPPHEGCSCCDDTWIYADLIHKARQLRNKDHPTVVLLRADAQPPVRDVYFEEWMEKAGGALCEWDTSSVDMTPLEETAP